ncbi:hypothetical protein [Luteimonas lutimaris]|uniref:Uncharacterized protein n=1 Tax=Luteimonas lutimaris TaxID=698645 RepID=A0ABP7MBX8_9GAMM
MDTSFALPDRLPDATVAPERVALPLPDGTPRKSPDSAPTPLHPFGA